MGGIKEGRLKWIMLEGDVNWTINKGVIAKFEFRPLEFFPCKLSRAVGCVDRVD